MIARRLALVCPAVVMVAAGCSWIDPLISGSHAPKPATKPAVVTAAPTRGAATGDAKEELKKKAELYAQSAQPLIIARTTAAKPAAKPPQVRADAPPTDPAASKWLDPDEMRLTTPATAGVPAPQVIIVAPPKTNTDAAASNVKTVETRPATPVPVFAGSVDPLERRLAQRLKDSPRDLASQLDYQLVQLLGDQQVPQIPVIASLSPEDREVLMTVLDGLSNFRVSARSEGNVLLSKKVRPMLEMADRLRSTADLEVPTVSLCRRVDGFGVYEPIEPARFVTGREHPVIIYCEVENFSSRLNEKKLWETRLTQETVLYTESGQAVWQEKSRMIVDQARNRRHDFFTVRMAKLPAQLEPGKYLLKVTVIDQQVKRVAEGTATVQVVGQ